MDDQSLKIAIERIVRPIRATAPRTLRMRRELLTHLQAAFNEELTTAADEPAALARALDRLGKPEQLTAELQRSIPWFEKLLLARLPVPALERLEHLTARRLGMNNTLTMLNASMLLFVSLTLVMAAGFFSTPLLPLPEWARIRLFEDGNAILLAALTLLPLLIYLLACRLAIIASTQPPPANPTVRRTVHLATAMIILLLLWDSLLAALLAQRFPSALELARSLAAGILLVTLQIAAARFIAARQRPHNEWLTLDLAA